MKPEQKERIREIVESEGLDYALIHYSEYDDINDKKFHRLRLDYIKLVKEIENHLDIKGD